MSTRAGYVLLSSALVVYLALAGQRGVLLIAQGTWATVPLGAAVAALPLLGAWFLWRSTRFVRAAHRLAKELAAEDGPPQDGPPGDGPPGDALAGEGPPRGPGGRIAPDAGDAAFARRRAEAEAAPGDWRGWFRLAVAYHEASDTPRARRAMRHAISLHAATRH